MNKEQLCNLESKIPEIGSEMYELMSELYPICRSITGEGVRETLKIIKKHVPIEIYEVPSGTNVFDWTIPKEWNIDDAYVIDPNGKKIIDFKKLNLHVVNYSIPINAKISLSELKMHIHTIPEQPNVIPYVTSYYDENWGFCMSHNEFLKLKEGEYHVVIKSELKKGYLTYGEFLIKGESTEEIILTCYICHPSLCNDNLSGVVMCTMLAKYIKKISNKYSIRFLFIPETIGAITWLSRNEKEVSKIKHGLVVTCVGDSGNLTYKKSRSGNEEIDKAVLDVLKKSNSEYNVLDFFPWGSDERQFCSPGFNLPFGSLVRSLYGGSSFPEYHTSNDNLNFVKKKYLMDSLWVYLQIIENLENKFIKKSKIDTKQKRKSVHVKSINNNMKSQNLRKFLNKNPKCEPQLGKRGLYHMIGGQNPEFKDRTKEFAIFWVLNLSDGNTSIIDISKKSGLNIDIINRTIKLLSSNQLLKEIIE
jgi:aminopeptidase-like protein